MHGFHQLRGIALDALAAATALGQQPARAIQDLGAPQRGEPAERALVHAGAASVPCLQGLLVDWSPSQPQATARLHAALRVIDLLGADAAELAPALVDLAARDSSQATDISAVRASLAPYADTGEAQTLLSRMWMQGTDDVRATAIATYVRFRARDQVRPTDDAKAMRLLLLQDDVFAREVAAEALARMGDEAAIDLLHDRLQQRERRPNGWDQLTHNGFVVPIDDRFRLRASEALIRLAPDDVRAAIAYATRAQLHPHASVRLESLAALSHLGHAARLAIPELLELAAGDDDRLAVEALKLLGMANEKVGPALDRIDALAATGDGARARLARSLGKRLRAMGFEPALPAPPTADELQRERLAGLVAQLTDDDDETMQRIARELAAGGRPAWDLLVDRFRLERQRVPDRVLRLLAELAWQRPVEDRNRVRHAIAIAGGDHWSASQMSMSTGGAQMRELDREIYARLSVDPGQELAALMAMLQDDNACVRRAAVRVLAARQDEWATAETALAGSVREQLAVAARTEHPAKSPFLRARRSKTIYATDLTATIQAESAAALLRCQLDEATGIRLLPAIVRHRDPAIAVAGIERWASADSIEPLRTAAGDEREAVREAAKAALRRLAK